MSNDRVSVVIASYNCAGYLPAAIDSLLAQTRTPDEIIVVDDGSTDDTANVLASYGRAVTAIRQRNQGECVARNTGIAAATGRYVAVLDSDDLCAETRLERQLAALKGAPDAVACFSGHYVFNEHRVLRTFAGNQADGDEPPLVHAARCLVFGPTLLFDRDKARGLRYPPGVTCGGDVLFMALLRSRGRFVVLPDVLYGYRRREGQVTQNLSFLNGFEQRVAWLQEHWAEWPGDRGVDPVATMWTEFARLLETFYWSRDRERFIALRDFLRRRWPSGLDAPPQLSLRWHPDWLWKARRHLDEAVRGQPRLAAVRLAGARSAIKG